MSIAQMLASPSHAYRLGVGKSGAVEAFAILRGLGDPHANLYLKRIAAARPGQGLGTAFLSLVLEEAFGPMGAERLYLDCFADNVRAQRSYEKLGFTRDGVLRQAYRLGRRDASGSSHDGDPEDRVERAPALTRAGAIFEFRNRAFSMACGAIRPSGYEPLLEP